MLALSGTLDPLHLNDLLEWLHMTRATGRLFLATGVVTRTFDFAGGKVIFSSSSRAAERLASWLLRKRLVSRPVLLKCLAVSQIQGEPFTTVMLREGHVGKDELVAAGTSLAIALASRVLREERVLFRFDPHYPVRLGEPVNLELACSQLIMEAAVSADSRTPTDHGENVPPTSLEPPALEALFWSTLQDLSGTPVDPMEVVAAHETLLRVGELLARWVGQGPPLLPLPPREVNLVSQDLQEGRKPPVEQAPTLAWDFLALVNGLDAPGSSRAASFHEAWVMAGGDALLLAKLLLENSRWRRERDEPLDETVQRLAMARAAAARALAPSLGLPEETAATAAVLPLVLLALVLTALSGGAGPSAALQRATVRRLLPLVGQAAGTASGLPEVLHAALTGLPAHHPGAQVAELAAMASGESGSGECASLLEDNPAVAGAFAHAREAAQKALEQPGMGR
ncbi:MAG: DUF4388 domain-containing protein [Thermoanaerobaculum sp.]|nr:DUF4388 domain-containing protein [Thermoanaerobaculum sp.]MDW7966692.1 DUF4388 domain-containing protein [Thermoanaerobaculum sp.]